MKDADGGDDLDDRDDCCEPSAGDAQTALVRRSVGKVRQEDVEGGRVQREDGEGGQEDEHRGRSQQLRNTKVRGAGRCGIIVESIDDADGDRLGGVIGVRLPKESGLLAILVFSVLGGQKLGLGESL